MNFHCNSGLVICHWPVPACKQTLRPTPPPATVHSRCQSASFQGSYTALEDCHLHWIADERLPRTHLHHWQDRDPAVCDPGRNGRGNYDTHWSAALQWFRRCRGCGERDVGPESPVQLGRRWCSTRRQSSQHQLSGQESSFQLSRLQTLRSPDSILLHLLACTCGPSWFHCSCKKQ